MFLVLESINTITIHSLQFDNVFLLNNLPVLEGRDA